MRNIVSEGMFKRYGTQKTALVTELLYGVGGPGVYGMCLYDKMVFRDGVQDVGHSGVRPVSENP